MQEIGVDDECDENLNYKKYRRYFQNNEPTIYGDSDEITSNTDGSKYIYLTKRGGIHGSLDEIQDPI